MIPGRVWSDPREGGGVIPGRGRSDPREGPTIKHSGGLCDN